MRRAKIGFNSAYFAMAGSAKIVRLFGHLSTQVQSDAEGWRKFGAYDSEAASY